VGGTEALGGLPARRLQGDRVLGAQALEGAGVRGSGGLQLGSKLAGDSLGSSLGVTGRADDVLGLGTRGVESGGQLGPEGFGLSSVLGAEGVDGLGVRLVGFSGTALGACQVGPESGDLGLQGFDALPRAVGCFFGLGLLACRLTGRALRRGSGLVGLHDGLFGLGHLAGGLGPGRSELLGDRLGVRQRADGVFDARHFAGDGGLVAGDQLPEPLQGERQAGLGQRGGRGGGVLVGLGPPGALAFPPRPGALGAVCVLLDPAPGGRAGANRDGGVVGLCHRSESSTIRTNDKTYERT